jgi:hypothetical protein
VIILIISDKKYNIWSSSYVDCSSLLLLSHSWVQIFPSSPCSQTPSTCVLPLVWEIKFHTHTRYQVYLCCYIRRPFSKFVDSPYYSESDICGGAVTVSFEVPLLASDALLRTLHPLVEIVLQTVNHFEISYVGAPFSCLEEPRNRMVRDLDCMADVLMEFHRSTFSTPNTEFNSDLAPMRFLGFFNHEKGAQRQEISKWSTVCNTFSKSGWSVVRSASLSVTRHRTSTKFRLGVIRCVHELFERPSCFNPYIFFIAFNFLYHKNLRAERLTGA